VVVAAILGWKRQVNGRPEAVQGQVLLTLAFSARLSTGLPFPDNRMASDLGISHGSNTDKKPSLSLSVFDPCFIRGSFVDKPVVMNEVPPT
jgi:hypothetical protein